MARYIGFLKGGRGAVSRLGTPNSGMSAEARGWNLGVNASVRPFNDSDQDSVTARVTGGSNNSPHVDCCLHVDPAESSVRLDGFGLAMEEGDVPVLTLEFDNVREYYVIVNQESDLVPPALLNRKIYSGRATAEQVIEACKTATGKRFLVRV